MAVRLFLCVEPSPCSVALPPTAAERGLGSTESTAERQRERHARQRKKFRENYPRRHEHPAEKEPELMGKEKVRPIVEARRADDERVRIEHQRQKVGITAEVFLSDELEGASGFRWQELRALWTQRGGKGEELRRAVQDAPYRFRREEADGGALYVYPKEAAKHRPERQKPAAVVPMRHEAKPQPAWTLHQISEEHPLVCECHDCTTRAPSYAKIGSTA